MILADSPELELAVQLSKAQRTALDIVLFRPVLKQNPGNNQAPFSISSPIQLSVEHNKE
jgi:hypothetical protein